MRLRSICVSVLLVAAVFAAATFVRADEPLRAGIIGLTTSHVKAFTGAINDPKAEGPLADVKVVAGFPGGMKDNPSSWDRVEMFTGWLRDQGCTIYDTIPEMLQHVDVVLLESVDGRPHLEQARPVIAAGKPLFIDKPMAASLADVMEIFRLAQQNNVPCFSSSSLRFMSDLQKARQGKLPCGKVNKCLAWSPMSTEPHHPDLFWYGVHGCEILFTVMGTGCKTVTRVQQNKVVGVWEDGREGTFFGGKVDGKSYGAKVEGSKGSDTVGRDAGYKPLVVEICKFFKTGKPPVAAEETIELFAFMEAADESKRQGGATVTIESVMEKARKINAERK